MKSWIATAVGALLMSALIGAVQTVRYEINGLYYNFPAAHGVGALVNDGLGNLSWSGSSIPTGMVFPSITGTCPTGWTEYTAARGRYIVGTPSGGTNGTTIGTALTDLENRETPQHTHTATLNATLFDSGHTHAVVDPGHDHPSTRGSGAAEGFPLWNSIESSQNSSSSTTGITMGSTAPGLSVTPATSILPAGTVGGTVAPYIQMPYCVKS